MNRESARQSLRAAVRRGLGKVDAVDKLVSKRAARDERIDRLVKFYDTLRSRLSNVPPPQDDLPSLAQIDRVQRVALDHAASVEFLRVMTIDHDFDAALVSVVRKLTESGNVRRARPFAQVVRHRAGLEQVGDICFAIVVMREPMYETAWELFQGVDLALVMRVAPIEYFRVGFTLDPETALATLQRRLDNEFSGSMTSAQWLEIARATFALGAEALSERACKRVEQNLSRVADAGRAKRLRGDGAALRASYGRRHAADFVPASAAGVTDIAVFDYQEATRRTTKLSEAQALNSLAALGNVVRHRNVEIAGDDGLSDAARALQGQVSSTRTIDGGGPAPVRLWAVDRDSTSYSSVPAGTWVLVSGALMEKVADQRYDFPLDERLRPIFLGVEINAPLLRLDGAIEYLKRYAPIGCRDWRTVFTLQAAGIPAFFSGWVTTSLDNFDLSSAAEDPNKFRPGLPQALVSALNTMRAYHSGGAPKKVSDLRTHLAARTAGGRSAFRPGAAHAGDCALDGLVDVSDAEFTKLQRSVLDPAAAVFGAIVAGASEDEVYALWRSTNEAAVADAEAHRQDVPPVPAPSFDIEVIVRDTLARSVVKERTQPAPSDGVEVNIEFSTDANLKHALDVVLESIVVNTDRPVRAFVLVRQHTEADFERMAKLFPTVSFVWLPTDHADYGDVHGMLKHVTVSTMDRLILPNLLPDVDRIIHFDLDTICIGDIGDLFDTELGDSPVAARDQRHPFHGSGYLSMINLATRARSVPLSVESMQRLSTRHPFDFRNFNAGIMVLNTKKMREDDFAHNFLPLIERLGYNGQTIMNHYAGTTYVDFPRGWNAYPRYELIEDAQALHFLGPTKAWLPQYIEGQPLWHAAEKTFAARAKAAGVKPSPPIP